MNPILLSRHLQESLREFVHATLDSPAPSFEGMVDRFLANPSNLIKGPWFSVDMPFRQIERAADGTWNQPFPDVPLVHRPYRHQTDAFARLSGDAMSSTLVTAGTGSGKTESYLWPILEYCRLHKNQPGIKAILIYPMNALAFDQARRIAEAITSIHPLNGVRAGIYADAEPPNAAVDAAEVKKEGIIAYRDAMRSDPPDILLTNYRMLDYLLLRASDKRLWEKNAPETLRFLVVDELHTFDGAQGADLALLIRRLKHRLGTPDNHLVCVGSSATLGPGDEAEIELRSYAERIFGEPFDGGAVVRESRKSPSEVFGDPEYMDLPAPESISEALAEAVDLAQPQAAMRLSRCLFADGDDPDITELRGGKPAEPAWRISLGERLLEHFLVQRTLKIASERPGPVSLEHIANDLARVKALGDWTVADRRALSEMVLALVAWARSGTPKESRPLFNLRLQIWVRELARMVSNLPRIEADGLRSPIDLYHSPDLDENDLRRRLPLVTCDRCGATAHLGRWNEEEESCWAPLHQLYEEFFDPGKGQRLRLFYHESIDEKARRGGKRVVEGLLDSITLVFRQSAHDDPEPGSAAPVWMYDPRDEEGRVDRTCPACGNSRAIALFGMRAARLTAGIAGTLYSSTQNEEEPADKPRLLMFSDSVQDAAHRAAVAEMRSARWVFQKSLHQALERRNRGRMTLEQAINEVPTEEFDDLGPDDFVALFIAKEQAWREDYQKLIREMGLSEGPRITGESFLEQVRIRLGWEHFADLSYRSHFGPTLETNGFVAVDVPAEQLLDSAERLSRQLANAFPAAERIPEEMLTRFLLGILRRMRKQGAVAHPYVAFATAASRAHIAPNWYAAAGKMRLGRTRTLPILDYRRGLSPIPISLRSGAGGFESILRKHKSNWYRDWLFRVLGAADVRIGSDPDEVYPLVLDRLNSDGIAIRKDGADGSDLRAWLVDPAHISISTAAVSLSCDRCGRRETTLAENADFDVGSECSRIACDGHLREIASPTRTALRRSLSSDRNHRVVAREHTAILEAEERRRIESGFMNGEERWSPNLISATPTLELGIDIGDLSTVLLSSVPPEEANYVQRMGRSGRWHGNALNLVLANARAHDLEFWEDPSPMLAGRVRPPGVFLEAEEVLLRQAAAFSIDVHVSSTEDADDFGKMREVLKRRESGTSRGFPAEWLDMVRNLSGELADAFLSILPPDVRGRKDIADRVRTFLGGGGKGSIAWLIDSVLEEAARERERLQEKIKEATLELRRLRDRRAELTEEEFEKLKRNIARDRKEINRMIQSGIDDVSVLKYLTDKGVLPNYAFPEEGAKLTSILSRRESDEAEEELRFEEYPRPADAALSEFAPGQIFYANGRQVRIDRIELGHDDLSVWTFCPSCSFASPRHEHGEDGVCPKCGDEMWSDSGSRREVARLRAVVSVGSEGDVAIRDRDERDRRRFDRQLIPFHGREDVAASWHARQGDGAPFGFEFIPDCEFRDFNFGSKAASPTGPKIAGERRQSRPFRICRHCGTWQKLPRNDENRGEHPPNCRVNGDRTLARDKWETEVFLMRGFATEAIRMVIPVAGEADPDDLKSFGAAINLGMRRHFAGKVDHIRSVVHEARLDEMASVRSLYLYDTVPGGSGYLRQVGEHPSSMRSVIEKAASALRDCPCNDEPDRNGCYLCVKSYRERFGSGEPNRDRAREMIEAVLRSWDELEPTETDTTIDVTIRDAVVESALEMRFLDALSRDYGEHALKPVILEGGRRGYALRAGSGSSPRRWTIEPQVRIDARYRELPKKRVDFLLVPAGRDELPVVVEMDGVRHHAETVDRDLLDRIEMIRSGKVRVWTLTWKDMDQDPDAPRNPLSETELSKNAAEWLGKVMNVEDFALLEDAVQAIRNEGSFDALRRLLDGETVNDIGGRSVLVRGIVGKGMPPVELPRLDDLSDEGREFLLAPELLGHVGAGNLDLYLACGKIPLAEWRDTDRDLRILLHARLAAQDGEVVDTGGVWVDGWRGLWRLVNLFQEILGFHVEVDGLDTLLPPEMSGRDDPDKETAKALAWAEIRTLCPEEIHPMIDALAAKGTEAPDRIGEDLFDGKGVLGVMEFGWSAPRVAVAIATRQVDDQPFEYALPEGVAITPELCQKTAWFLMIPFDPESDSVEDAVARVLRALEE